MQNGADYDSPLTLCKDERYAIGMGSVMNYGVKYGASVLALLGFVGLIPACGATGDGLESLPKFKSLDATYQAVDEAVNCTDDAPDPPHKVAPEGGPTGESVMCTNTVEVLWFESNEARENVYELYSSAAGPAGSVRFVEGQNWLVVDGSEVKIGKAPKKLEKRNLERLAEKLDGRFTVEQ